MTTANRNDSTRTRFSAAIAFIAFVGFGKCSAATIEFTIRENDSRIVQSAQISANKIFVRGVGGDSDSDLLFDATREVLFIIDHRNRSYLQIDNDTINEVAALSETVANAVGAENTAVREVLGNLGIVEVPGRVATTIDTGSTLIVGGYPCSLHRSYLAGDLVSEICIAQSQSLNLSPEDFRVLRSFWLFSVNLVNRAERLLVVLGPQLPRMKLDDAGGVPIAIYTTTGHRHVRLTRIDRTAGPVSIFRMPENYTRTRIPFVSN